MFFISTPWLLLGSKPVTPCGVKISDTSKVLKKQLYGIRETCMTLYRPKYYSMWSRKKTTP
jgi:hypothetical protein